MTLFHGLITAIYTVGFAQTEKIAHRIPGILAALQAENRRWSYFRQGGMPSWLRGREGTTEQKRYLSQSSFSTGRPTSGRSAQIFSMRKS